MSTKYKDYYQILGVGRNATPKEIKSAYRKLARELHPDANPDNPAAEERFKEASEAYEVLGDEKKRQAYDESGRYYSGGAGPNVEWSDFNPGEAGFNLGDLFGMGFEAQAAGRRRGADLVYNAHLSFDEALKGKEVSLGFERESTCSQCGGSGAKPGASLVDCKTCGGSGRISANQGLFSVARICPACRGKGKAPSDPCARCGGTGQTIGHVTERIRLPAGVEDGSRIKFKGKGQAGQDGGPAGDLVVIVKVAPHPYFNRKGPDVLLDLPITYAEAVLGSSIHIPTPDGSVSLRIPAGTQSGKTLRLRGKGAPRLKSGGKGDLLVTVDVKVPTDLTDDERDLIVRLSQVTKDKPRAGLFEP
ncbi:MAG: molecular chaperone DnaJ [Candidatus Aquicultorales bacterium]